MAKCNATRLAFIVVDLGPTSSTIKSQAHMYTLQLLTSMSPCGTRSLIRLVMVVEVISTHDGDRRSSLILRIAHVPARDGSSPAYYCICIDRDAMQNRPSSDQTYDCLFLSHTCQRGRPSSASTHINISTSIIPITHTWVPILGKDVPLQCRPPLSSVFENLAPTRTCGKKTPGHRTALE